VYGLVVVVVKVYDPLSPASKTALPERVQVPVKVVLVQLPNAMFKELALVDWNVTFWLLVPRVIWVWALAVPNPPTRTATTHIHTRCTVRLLFVAAIPIPYRGHRTLLREDIWLKQLIE
jgi:hypothetical protein